MPTIIDGSASATFQTPLPSSQVAVVNGSILPSMVWVHTANGFGSTNTRIRRFTTTQFTQGTDITYADSATLGSTFTINVTGVYAISYSDAAASAFTLGIFLNSAQLTTSVDTISMANKLITTSTNTTDEKSTAWTGFLSVTDVIRPHTSGVAGGSTTRAIFTIVRVA